MQRMHVTTNRPANQPTNQIKNTNRHVRERTKYGITFNILFRFPTKFVNNTFVKEIWIHTVQINLFVFVFVNVFAYIILNNIWHFHFSMILHSINWCRFIDFDHQILHAVSFVVL